MAALGVAMQKVPFSQKMIGATIIAVIAAIVSGWIFNGGSPNSKQVTYGNHSPILSNVIGSKVEFNLVGDKDESAKAK